MNVRDLEISLRPRQRWEAADLGIIIAREYFADLFKIGLIGFLPAWLIIIALTWQWPWLGLFLLWWFKPIYDRFYLHYLSQRIFGKKVSIKSVLKQAPRFIFKRSFSLLTWRRLSPNRSFNLAVRDLEGLKGKAYSRRCSHLSRVGGGISSTTTAAMHLCEQIAILALLILVYIFIPKDQLFTSLEETYQYFTNIHTNKAVPRVLSIITCLVYICLEPFYVGAGFSLYLNSRCTQEGWDIDLRFKEFASRMKKSVLQHGPTSILIATCFFLWSSPHTQAAENTQEVVAEVYEHDDFTIYTHELPRWEPPNWFFDLFKGGSLGKAPAGIESILKILGFSSLGALILILLFFLIKILMNKRREASPLTQKKTAPPSSIMGMEISRDSLPDNIIEAARQLWQKGERKQALSYLYRAALSDIILIHQADITSSDTESECLRAAKTVLQPNQSDYFSELTQGWISVAYSESPLDDQGFETLCQNWNFQLS